MPSYFLNDRHVATGVKAEGQRFAPKSRLGVLINWRSHAQSHAGNGCNMWIDPTANVIDEAKGVCKSIKTYFRRHVDAFRFWLDVSCGLNNTFIFDFEGLGGCSGDYRRTWSVDEPAWAARFRPHLVDGFHECAADAIRGGCEIVAHLGSPDSCDWASRLTDRDEAPARSELWRTLNDVYGPLIDAGVRIGFDAGAAMTNRSVTYKVAALFDSMGQPYQIEALPAIKESQWNGRTGRLVWEVFDRRHVQSHPLFYNVGSPRFAAAHPDVRVWINAQAFGAAPDYKGGDGTKAWLNAIADGTKKLLATTPVTVLLDDVIARFAIQTGKPASDFLA